MSTPPLPQIPPDVAASVAPDFEGWWATFFSSLSVQLPTLLEMQKGPTSALIAEVTATIVELFIDITSEIGKRIGESVDEFESTAGPAIEAAAAAALSDYFGTTISVGQISRGRSPGQRFAFAQNLGAFILEQMFGAFDFPGQITPELGRENAERILGFNVSTTLESWLGKVVSSTPLTRWIPNWADLDDVMQQTLGLGRINRRIMGPLLKTLVADPFAWDLNRTFTPQLFNAGQLVRLVNRKAIDEGTYFEQMSWHGFDQAKAANMRLLLSRLPEKEDIAKMLELGIITPERTQAIFEGLGFTPTGAEAMVAVTEDDRVRNINNAIESTARTMFRSREIDESELQVILNKVGRSPAEVEIFLGLARVERSRPRAMPRGVMEEGFRKGFIPLGRLREYYEAEGFSLDDRILLEEMAVEDRLEAEARDKAAREKAQTTEFRALPRGQIERAFIDGLIPLGRLREYYDAREFSPADQDVLLELVTKRKTAADLKLAEALARAQEPDFAKLPRSSIEEAFIRDVVNAGRLRDWYAKNGFAPGDIPILLSNARARKEAREERLEAELERANRPDFTELPRSVIETAFIRGLITEGRLSDWYQAREFRPAEIPILLELVRARKLELAAKAAASATKAKA